MRIATSNKFPAGRGCETCVVSSIPPPEGVSLQTQVVSAPAGKKAPATRPVRSLGLRSREFVGLRVTGRAFSRQRRQREKRLPAIRRSIVTPYGVTAGRTSPVLTGWRVVPSHRLLPAIDAGHSRTRTASVALSTNAHYHTNNQTGTCSSAVLLCV